jgi:hypothetical protein
MSAVKSACSVMHIGIEVMQPRVQARRGSPEWESAEVSQRGLAARRLVGDGSLPIADGPARISTACPRFWLRHPISRAP